MDGPRPEPLTRPHIAFVRRPRRCRYRRCPCLSYGPPRSRPEHRESIYEIRSPGQVRQNPWACNRRYRGQCSTYSDALFLPHHFRGDRVPVSGWVQLGLDSVCERGLLIVFTISIPSIRALEISSSIFSLLARREDGGYQSQVSAQPGSASTKPTT